MDSLKCMVLGRNGQFSENSRTACPTFYEGALRRAIGLWGEILQMKAVSVRLVRFGAKPAILTG